MNTRLTRSSRRVWCFGPFEFEAESGELRRRGRRVRLQPQAGRLLEILLRSSGRVVSRAELQAAIWDEGIHVNHAHAIDVLVSKVRAALGDRVDAPRYIETLVGRGYRFLAADAGAPRSLVAVLPGRGAPDDRADALLASVVSSLSRALPRDAAIVATSTSRALASASDVRAAAVEHGIRWIVEWGFLDVDDGRLLHAEIIRAADGSLAEACGGPTADDSLEAAGRALCSGIVAAIRNELGAAAPAPVSRPPTRLPTASEEALLEGHHHLLQRTAESIAKAERCIELALRGAHGNAAALALLGECRILSVDLGSAATEKGYEGARVAALDALDIEPDHPEALCVLAHVLHRYDWNWREAEDLYLRCLGSSPSMALGYHRYAEFLSQHRRHVAALEHIGQARRLDPLSMPVRAVHSWILLHAGRVAEAARVARAVVDLAPSFPLGLFCLGRALLHAGDVSAAVEALTRARRLTADAPYVSALLAIAAAGDGDDARARTLRDELQATGASAYLIARVELALGDRIAMRERLRAAFDERSGWMTDLAVDPELREAREDPVYVSLRRQMRF